MEQPTQLEMFDEPVKDIELVTFKDDTLFINDDSVREKFVEELEQIKAYCKRRAKKLAKIVEDKIEVRLQFQFVEKK